MPAAFSVRAEAIDDGIRLQHRVLSTRISAQTMDLNGLTGFTAALAGGSLAGPTGAFVALPVVAHLTGLFCQCGHSYDVVYSPSQADIG